MIINMPIDTFKYFGLYSIVIFSVVTAYIVIRWHSDNALTLSRHIASHKKLYILFAITSVLAQSLFWLFMVFWFAPHFNLGFVFIAIMTLGSIGQLTAALVPDKDIGGVTTIVHYASAVVMMLVMYTFTLWVSLSPAIEGFSKYFSAFAFVLMTILLIMLFSIKKARSKVFIYQNVYLAMFYLTVLVAAYTTSK